MNFYEYFWIKFTETADARQESGDTDGYKDETIPGFTLEPATDDDADETKSKVIEEK